METKTGNIFFERISVFGNESFFSEYAGGFRFGFNGKEKTDELYGTGNAYDYGMRMYDPRLGRFLSTDPLAKKYSYQSPYVFAENDLIRSTDLDGKERFIQTYSDKNGLSQVIALSSQGSLGEGTLLASERANGGLNFYYEGSVTLTGDQHSNTSIITQEESGTVGINNVSGSAFNALELDNRSTLDASGKIGLGVSKTLSKMGLSSEGLAKTGAIGQLFGIGIVAVGAIATPFTAAFGNPEIGLGIIDAGEATMNTSSMISAIGQAGQGDVGGAAKSLLINVGVTKLSGLAGGKLAELPNASPAEKAILGSTVKIPAVVAEKAANEGTTKKDENATK